ncbi:unnamed protein product [Ectocarpus sp. CCAP 1310/34]|nr:unnamed protein product [Ectocarpus sp. CCAP 1310/34]
MARICRRAAVVAVAMCSTSPASSFTPSTFVGGGAQSAVLCGKPSGSSKLMSPCACDASTPTMAMESAGGKKRARVRKVWRRGHVQAREVKDKLNAGVWDKFRAPPDARGHDEVTFRSGFEGRTLTIPQAERYSSSAWWHNLRTLPTSVILHRIKHPLLVQTFWATAVSLVHAGLGGVHSMSIKPHTLLGSALGLLLVFRTNAAYQRFQEGRKLWEEVLNVSRDIARMSVLYEDVFGRRLVQRIANLLACHAVILQEHLQGYKLPRVWEDLLRPEEVRDLMTTNCNRPLKVVNMISREIKSVPYRCEDWSSRERLAILSMCNKLGSTIGGCERLVQTPVPLHYVRHTSRFLTIWCFLLPLVIVGEMGMATAPVVFLATWALFGIQEIGLLIEDPFQSALSLDIMCNSVYTDVMQTVGVADPTLPQQPIPMQAGIAVADLQGTRVDEDVVPLSARCKHPVLADWNHETSERQTELAH